MPTCQNCHEKWTWKQTFKRSFAFGGMTCPFCEEKQYYSTRMRRINFLITIILFALIMITVNYLSPIYSVLFYFLVLFPLTLVIRPFFIVLSNEE